MVFIPLHDDNPRVLIAHPWVTWGLIVACATAFFYQTAGGAQSYQHLVVGFGLIPAVLVGGNQLSADFYLVPAVATLVTSLFLHGDILHLAGNMLYLWVFGDNIEDSMGHGKFLIFYLICGMAAGLTQVLADTSSLTPTIGASGAISGVLGAYLILHPRARILVPILIFPVYLPAFVLLLLWIGLQVYNAAGSGPSGGGVAWLAHIGGFLAGMALIAAFRHKAMPLFGGRPPRGVRLKDRTDAQRDRKTRRDTRSPWS